MERAGRMTSKKMHGKQKVTEAEEGMEVKNKSKNKNK